MIEVILDSKGNFAGAISKYGVYNLKSEFNNKTTDPALPKQAGENFIYNWGDNNLKPELLRDYVRKSTVLSAAIEYRSRLAIGQGIIAYQVVGYDDDGQEVKKPYFNDDIYSLLESNMVYKYLTEYYRDLFRYGNNWAEIILNKGRDKALGIEVKNARHCRFMYNEDKAPVELGLYGDWTNANKEKVARLPLLDYYDPISDLQNRQSGTNFIYHSWYPFSDNNFYDDPPWIPAVLSRWLDIVCNVPQLLIKVFENAISVKYHIQIPQRYWDLRFKDTEFKDVEEKKKLISEEIESFEKNLTGSSNAGKAIISHYIYDEENNLLEWKVQVLDDKFKNDHYLPQAAAGNSEILFSNLTNPAIIGAGLPGGGPYQGSNGGSNIRESFLVNDVLSYVDRKNALGPLELMIKYNYPQIKNLKLEFKRIVLTTLDTGKGTKTLS